MTMRQPDERGSALVLALGFMVVVLIIAAGVHGLVLNQLRASGALRQRIVAEYLAQGGVARTIGWFGSQGYQLPQATTLTSTIPVKLTANNNPVVLPSNHPANYTDALGQARTGVVTSYNNFATGQSMSVGTYSVVASLIAQQPETWELLATGQQGTVQRQVGALLIRRQDPLFAEAVFGRDIVTMAGNGYTDSYDSSLGAYGGGNKFQTGNVRSNGNIAVTDSAIVNGDAIPGPDMGVTGSGTVTGLKTPAVTPRVLTPIVIPGGAVNKGAINIQNGNYPLSPGNYVATSLTIGGSGRMSITGNSGAPVNLYVTGPISIGGNSVSNSANKNFFIYQVGGADVVLNGTGDLFAAVYAPDSALILEGTSDLYGGFVGGSVYVTGAGRVHYDQSLRTIPSPPGPMRLVAQWTLQS